MNNLALGRYNNENTIIHRLDPRNKFICFILLIVAIFFQFDTWAMTFLVGGVILILSFILMLVSKTSILDFFRSLRFLLILVVLLLLINWIFPSLKVSKDPSITYEYFVAFPLGTWKNVYWVSIFQTIKIFIRLINMLMITLILTSTTSSLELTAALEWFMTPLKFIKFPVHEIAMTLSLALRFIPTLLDETQRIMKSQTSRGIDYKYGSIANKFRGIVSLIVPLFVSAFQKSDELANAMEARGYDPKAKRTRYRNLKWGVKDFVSLALVVLLTAGVIYISVAKVDFFNLLNIDLPEVLFSGYRIIHN